MGKPLLWVLPLALGLPGQALDLEYRGVIAGADAGPAYVRIESDAERYEIRGMMRTHGVWNVLAPWNARFFVTGRIEDGRAVPETLVLHEKDRRKDRTIRVADGALRQLRNGRLRPERPAPPGVDLMSALWVTVRCDAEQVLNNGRHYYAMTRTEQTVTLDGVERCDYGIVDDDGERSRGRLELGERYGRRVPLRIVVDEGVSRGLELVGRAPKTVFDEWGELSVPNAMLRGAAEAIAAGVQDEAAVDGSGAP